MQSQKSHSQCFSILEYKQPWSYIFLEYRYLMYKILNKNLALTSGLIVLHVKIVEGFMELTGFIGQTVTYVIHLDSGGS